MKRFFVIFLALLLVLPTTGCNLIKERVADFVGETSRTESRLEEDRPFEEFPYIANLPEELKNVIEAYYNYEIRETGYTAVVEVKNLLKESAIMLEIEVQTEDGVVFDTIFVEKIEAQDIYQSRGGGSEGENLWEMLYGIEMPKEIKMEVTSFKILKEIKEVLFAEFPYELYFDIKEIKIKYNYTDTYIGLQIQNSWDRKVRIEFEVIENENTSNERIIGKIKAEIPPGKTVIVQEEIIAATDSKISIRQVMFGYSY